VNAITALNEINSVLAQLQLPRPQHIHLAQCYEAVKADLDELAAQRTKAQDVATYERIKKELDERGGTQTTPDNISKSESDKHI
jgi:hypothetical protein